jgi:hypothetical protein
MSLPIADASAAPSTPLPPATPVKSARSTMAIMSSKTSTAKTSPFTASGGLCSSKALATSMVDEMATAAPTNRLSRAVSPSSRSPARKPRENISPTSMTQVSAAPAPTRAMRRMLNSRPIENISRMTPSSDSVVTSCASATTPVGRCGPMISPAQR